MGVQMERVKVGGLELWLDSDVAARLRAAQSQSGLKAGVWERLEDLQGKRAEVDMQKLRQDEERQKRQETREEEKTKSENERKKEVEDTRGEIAGINVDSLANSVEIGKKAARLGLKSEFDTQIRAVMKGYVDSQAGPGGIYEDEKIKEIRTKLSEWREYFPAIAAEVMRTFESSTGKEHVERAKADSLDELINKSARTLVPKLDYLHQQIMKDTRDALGRTESTKIGETNADGSLLKPENIGLRIEPFLDDTAFEGIQGQEGIRVQMKDRLTELVIARVRAEQRYIREEMKLRQKLEAAQSAQNTTKVENIMRALSFGGKALFAGGLIWGGGSALFGSEFIGKIFPKGLASLPLWGGISIVGGLLANAEGLYRGGKKLYSEYKERKNEVANAQAEYIEQATRVAESRNRDSRVLREQIVLDLRKLTYGMNRLDVSKTREVALGSAPVQFGTMI